MFPLHRIAIVAIELVCRKHANVRNDISRAHSGLFIEKIQVTNLWNRLWHLSSNIGYLLQISPLVPCLFWIWIIINYFVTTTLNVQFIVFFIISLLNSYIREYQTTFLQYIKSNPFFWHSIFIQYTHLFADFISSTM